jgi:integrase
MARVTGHVYRVPGPGEKPESGRNDSVRKSGPAWYMSFRFPSGKQARKLIGEAWDKRSIPPDGFYRAKDAEEALQEQLAEIRRGEIPDPTDRATGRTFADAREEWLRYCAEDRGLEGSTLRDYRNTSRSALADEFGDDTPLEEIDEERIETYRARMLSGKVVARRGGRGEARDEDTEPISRRTAQKHLVMLGGIFKRAKRLKWMTVDPTTDIEPINVKRSGDFNVLSVQQVELIASRCEDEMFAAAIIVAAYTGLRTGELRALRWRDVDFANSTIHVRTNMPVGGEEKAPKSDQIRSAPLMDDAARALDGLSRRETFTGPDDRVFPSTTGGMLDEDALRDAFYEAMEAAGINRLGFPVKPGFRFHDLRHTFGTLAVSVWPLSDVQAYMGHADIQTTMRYVHHIPKTTAAREFTEAVAAMKKLAEDLPALAPAAAGT